MKKLPLVLVTLSFIISISSFAQVAIGTETLHNSAILQLESNEKGFLLLRMSNEDRKKIEDPAPGLQVFVTDFLGTNKGMILFYDGSEWRAFKELSSRPAAPKITVSRSRSNNSLGQQATIIFDTPADNGSTITDYQVIAKNLLSGEDEQSSFEVGTDSNVVVNGLQTQIVIPNLETNALYTFSVAAINAVGSSTQSDPSDIAPKPIAGDYLYGGVVFYIFEKADGNDFYVEGETHGLICAPKDLNSTYKWISEQYRDEVIDTEYIMGTGKQNTQLIIDKVENGDTDYAALQATLYRLDDTNIYASYSDWHLPSKDELLRMYLNRRDVNPTLLDNGGDQLSNENYWSSSQDIGVEDQAWRQNLHTGDRSGNNKTTLYKVRPIRSF